MPHSEFPVQHGRSILRMLEDQLDEAYDKYVKYNSADDPEDFQRGVCQGLAQAVALIKTPYRPNVSEAKREAKARYDRG